MSYSDNYPAGAANDPRAPYNQMDPEAVAFDVTATFTIEKTVELTTVQYEGGETDDEGYTEPYDTLGVDWKDEYKEQQYNPVELLEKLADQAVIPAPQLAHRLPDHRIEALQRHD